MNLKELVCLGREETQDLATPPAWSDVEWRAYFNEADTEASIRARLIVDDDIEIYVTAGEAYADYPAYVWSIRRVRLVGGRALELVDREMLDASEGSGWEDRTGTPVACYEVGGRIRFFPIPEATGTARMEAFCTPKQPMRDPANKPGTPERLHRKLLDWALHLAYSKKDTDHFDANLAARHEAEFEKTFGPRPDEKAMRRMRINVRRRVAGHNF